MILIDFFCMVENFCVKVIIFVYYDIWFNFMVFIDEIL